MSANFDNPKFEGMFDYYDFINICDQIANEHYDELENEELFARYDFYSDEVRAAARFYKSARDYGEADSIRNATSEIEGSVLRLFNLIVVKFDDGTEHDKDMIVRLILQHA